MVQYYISLFFRFLPIRGSLFYYLMFQLNVNPEVSGLNLSKGVVVRVRFPFKLLSGLNSLVCI